MVNWPQVTAVCAAVGTALIPSRGLCDSQIDVANQTAVKGTLQPVTENETISFIAPAGAEIAVRCTGRNGLRPRIVLRPPAGPDLSGTESKSASELSLTAASTGTHVVAVASRDDLGGDYTLLARWTPQARFAGPATKAGAERTFTFTADAGSVAAITARGAPGTTAFVPGITAVTGPQAFGRRELGGRAKETVTLGGTGEYTISLDDGPADADVVVTVRLRVPRSGRRTIDVSSAVIGNGGAFVPGTFVVGRTVSADGGLVAVDTLTNLGGDAFDLAGASVLIPPGAFPSATTIVVGSSKPVRENRGVRNLGATVYFSPEGKTFGTPDAPQKALVTIPVSQSVLQGDSSRIRLTTRDERGRVSDVRFTQDDKDAGFPDFTSRPGFVTFPVSHFSSYAATLGKVSPDDPSDNLQYGGTMSASAGGLIVSARSAAYVYDVDDGEVTFDAKLVGSGIGAQDEFGYSVALEGDIAVVSAPHPNQDFDSRAAVFIFRRVSGAWTEQTKISTPQPDPGSQFGVWVNVSRGQVCVGAPALSKVYVYEETKSGWVEKQVISAGDDLGRSQSSAFGTVVAIDGDTMVVAAPNRDERRGAAYVFTRSAGTWTERAVLTVDGAPGDTLSRGPGNGTATISGDTIVLGAAFSNSGRGAAHVFRGSGANWAPEQEILPTDDDLPAFASGVGISGDRLVLGAIDGDNNSGAVYLYRRSGTVWTRSDSFVPPVHRPGDFFGSAPTFLGGRLAAVGANYDVPESTGIRSGSIYLFEVDEE